MNGDIPDPATVCSDCWRLAVAAWILGGRMTCVHRDPVSVRHARRRHAVPTFPDVVLGDLDRPIVDVHLPREEVPA